MVFFIYRCVHIDMCVNASEKGNKYNRHECLICIRQNTDKKYVFKIVGWVGGWMVDKF